MSDQLTFEQVKLKIKFWDGTNFNPATSTDHSYTTVDDAFARIFLSYLEEVYIGSDRLRTLLSDFLVSGEIRVARAVGSGPGFVIHGSGALQSILAIDFEASSNYAYFNTQGTWVRHYGDSLALRALR